MAERFLQNAYWVRKFRTRNFYFDTDKNGYVTRDDFVLLAELTVEKGKMSGESAQRTRRNIMGIWNSYGMPDDAVLEPEKMLRMMAEMLAGKVLLGGTTIYTHAQFSQVDMLWSHYSTPTSMPWTLTTTERFQRRVRNMV